MGHKFPGDATDKGGPQGAPVSDPAATPRNRLAAKKNALGTAEALTDALTCSAGEEFRLPPPAFAEAGGDVYWEQVAGPVAEPDDRSLPAPTVRVPATLVNTLLIFEAAPARGQAPVHTVALWVSPDAEYPAANAGRTQVVAEGETVLLDGRETRLPEGACARDVGWEWIQVAGPPVALSDPWSLTPAFRAPEGLVSSDVRLELRVTHGDDDGTSSVATVNVLVCGTEETLAVESATPPHATAGDFMTLQASVETAQALGLRWRWRQVGGPPVVLEDDYTERARFAAPLHWRNVPLAFEATVHDGARTGSTRVDILVEPDEEAPRVEISGRPTAADGDLVQLEAQLRGHPLEGWSTRWIQLDGPPVLLSTSGELESSTTGHTATARASFVAPNVARTSIVLGCVATNGREYVLDTTKVSVEGDEDAPVVDAGSAQAVEPGAHVELIGHASGSEGAPVRVLWSQVGGPRVALSDATSLQTSFEAPTRVADDDRPLSATLVFALHAFTGKLESVDTVSVRVGHADPLATPHAGVLREVHPGDRVRLGEWSEDELAFIESCSWRQVSGPPVQLENENGPAAWFRAPDGYANTRLVFELDAVVSGLRTLDTVAVTLEPDEDAPIALASADRRASARELVRLAAFARDPEGLSLETRWRQVSGPAVELDDPTTVRPTFAAPVLARSEALVFELAVTDGVVTVVETVRVVVDAASVDELGSLLPGRAAEDPSISRAG